MPDVSLYANTPKQRSYLQLSPDIVTNSLKQIADDRENAAKQQSAITLALAQMRDKMHTDESAFMNDYINNIQEQVEGLANEGNYRGAINSAITLAGKAAADPALSGRIKANTAYQSFVEQTQARKDISQDIKDWAIALNPYHYEDKKDDKGNIIGGTDWKPNITPVSQISLADLGSQALSWVKPDESSSSGNAKFVDSNGDLTDKIEDAVDVAWVDGSSTKLLGKSKLMQAINAAIEMTPGAKESLQQDYNVAKWQYDNLPEEEKNNIVGTDIIDANGRMYTPQEYIQKRIQPWLNAAQFSNRSYTKDYKTGLATRAAIKAQAQAAQAATLPFEGAAISKFYTKTTPISYDVTDLYGDSVSKVTDAINDITKAMPALAKTAGWQKAVQEADYARMLELVDNTKMSNGKVYRDSINSYNKNVVNKAYKDLLENYKFLNETKSKLSTVQFNALSTKTALDNGNELPANNFSISLNKYLDKINNGAGKNASSIGIDFSSEKAMQEVIDYLGWKEDDFRRLGITRQDKDGRIILKVNKNNSHIFNLISSWMSNDVDSFWTPWNNTQIVTYDSAGHETSRGGKAGKGLGQRINTAYRNVTRKILPIAGRISADALAATEQNFNSVLGVITTPHRWVSGESNPLYDIRGIVNMINSSVNSINPTKANLQIQSEVMISDIPDIAEAKRKAANGEITQADLTSKIKLTSDDLASKMVSTDFTQTKIFGIDEDTNSLSAFNNEDSKTVWEELAPLMKKDNVSIELGSDGILHGYVVTVVPDEKNKNDIIKKPTRVFITGLPASEQFDKYITDSKTVAVGDYKRRQVADAYKQDVFGNKIQVIDDNGGFVNGVPVSKKDILDMLERDNLIERAAKHSKIRQPIQNIAMYSQIEQTPEVKNNIELERQKLVSEAQNAAAIILSNFNITPQLPNYDSLLNIYTSTIIENASK